jgi:hypothetical protein
MATLRIFLIWLIQLCDATGACNLLNQPPVFGGPAAPVAVDRKNAKTYRWYRRDNQRLQ